MKLKGRISGRWLVVSLHGGRPSSGVAARASWRAGQDGLCRSRCASPAPGGAPAGWAGRQEWLPAPPEALVHPPRAADRQNSLSTRAGWALRGARATAGVQGRAKLSTWVGRHTSTRRGEGRQGPAAGTSCLLLFWHAPPPALQYHVHPACRSRAVLAQPAHTPEMCCSQLAATSGAALTAAVRVSSTRCSTSSAPQQGGRENRMLDRQGRRLGGQLAA